MVEGLSNLTLVIGDVRTLIGGSLTDQGINLTDKNADTESVMQRSSPLVF